MYGDIIVLVYGPVIKVWNFVQDKWATWRTSFPHYQSLQVKCFEFLQAAHD